MKQQQQLNITLDKTLPIVCEHCGSETFKEGMFLRKASKFLTGQAQDSIIPVPTFICAQCGKVNEEFSLKQNP
jgi:DNA-directed RNA polymerase subunit RPC12/RpoP